MPPGLAPIADRDYLTALEDGWVWCFPAQNPARHFAIVQDPSMAGRGTPATGVATFPDCLGLSRVQKGCRK